MKYCYTVMDRDGDILAYSEEEYDTPEEAYEAGRFHEDDPRYGSHEAEEI